MREFNTVQSTVNKLRSFPIGRGMYLQENAHATLHSQYKVTK